MANNKTTLKDVYDIVDKRTASLDTKLDTLGGRVSALEIWRANLMGKVAVVTGIAVLGFNLVIEYFKVNFFERR